jgi:HD superfamily phosphohydrolase
MARLTLPPLELRDPVHGAISVDLREAAVVDHPAVQRLRNIRQLGFSHLPFPGATHSRFIHSLGAMHLAGLAFDSVFRDRPFLHHGRYTELRHCVRLAALCHDLGHAPYSHAAEHAMPILRELGIDVYDSARVAPRLAERAHHEDYTVAVLTRSNLAGCIARHFPFSARHVAALVSADVDPVDDFFVEDGLDLRGVLSQLISSELDVDRLDYLQRDALFTGARYGQIDAGWLISHLSRHIDERGAACLALDQRALYALDDFLIARFHMFVMVYFHRKSVVYEEMLHRWVDESAGGFALPSDVEAYLETDDTWMWQRLRESESGWAKRITRYDPFKLALEVMGSPEQEALPQRVAALRAEGIDALGASAWGRILGKADTDKPPLYIIGEEGGVEVEAHPAIRRLADLTPARLGREEGACISRIYVAPEDLSAAKVVLQRVWRQPSLLS